MAARHVAPILFLVFYGSIEANSSTLLRITNLRYTNSDFVYTAHWDRLAQDVDDPVRYTLRVDDEMALPGCTNITENSCLFEFDDPVFFFDFQVEASVNGVRTAESEVEQWTAYDIAPEISAPRVNISRSGNNITAHLEFPSQILENSGKFKVEFFQRVNQTKEKSIKEEKETADTTLSFITSVPENATVCIKVRIEVTDSSFYPHSSNVSQACVDGILYPDHPFPIETHDPRASFFRLWLLIGVAIAIGVVLVITFVLICKKRCKNTFRQPDTEIPKNMALVIAGSDEKSPSHQTGKGDKIENVCLIIGEKTFLDSETDDFNATAPNDTALNELDTLMKTREFPKERKSRLESMDSAFCDVLCSNTDSGDKPDSPNSTDHLSRHLSADSLFSADEGYVRIPSPHKQDTL